MQPYILHLAGWLTLLALSVAPAVAAQPAGHEHEAETHALQLDHGRKWSTDAPLREGMSAIRDAVGAQHHAIHLNQASTANYHALAKKVDEQVAYMVANCKLSPEADANLHVILADIIAGSDLMKGQDKAKSRDGAIKIMAALETYPKYFEHPGWRGVE
jgi:hypothetical protein